MAEEEGELEALEPMLGELDALEPPLQKWQQDWQWQGSPISKGTLIGCFPRDPSPNSPNSIWPDKAIETANLFRKQNLQGKLIWDQSSKGRPRRDGSYLSTKVLKCFRGKVYVPSSGTAIRMPVRIPAKGSRVLYQQSTIPNDNCWVETVLQGHHAESGGCLIGLSGLALSH